MTNGNGPADPRAPHDDQTAVMRRPGAAPSPWQQGSPGAGAGGPVPPYGQAPPAQSQYGQPFPYGQAPQYGHGFTPQAGPQQPFGTQPPGPAKKKPVGVLIGAIAGGVVLIAAIVALTGFVWPGWVSTTLNQTAVQDGVAKILTGAEPEGYGISGVTSVECPSGQQVDTGHTFTCSVQVNGENKNVTITVTDSKGTYEVSRPTN